jgi:hypothetical protein
MLAAQDKQGKSEDRDLPRARFQTLLAIDHAALEQIANEPNPANDRINARDVTRSCLNSSRCAASRRRPLATNKDPSEGLEMQTKVDWFLGGGKFQSSPCMSFASTIRNA